MRGVAGVAAAAAGVLPLAPEPHAPELEAVVAFAGSAVPFVGGAGEAVDAA